MIVSGDWQEVSVLECILSGLHIGVDVESQPERAWDKLAKTKIDALILDCDMAGTNGLLEQLQAGLPNSVPVLIASGSRGKNQLAATGASFVVEKPISVERAVHTLSAARNMILSGRLRYHRQGLNLPATAALKPGKRMNVRVINLSQGGARIRARKGLSAGEMLKLRFTLPGIESAVNVTGSVAWIDPKAGAGVRFLNLKESSKRDLQLWLERQYFQPAEY
jgi:CheY-like chemotaxis protein